MLRCVHAPHLALLYSTFANPRQELGQQSDLGYDPVTYLLHLSLPQGICILKEELPKVNESFNLWVTTMKAHYASLGN